MVSSPLAAFVNQQMLIAPDALAAYSERAATRSEYGQLMHPQLADHVPQPPE